MLELQITSPKQGTELQPIEFNYEELKKDLAQALKKYQSLVYTQENVGDAKRTLADLRKLRRAIEDRRKEVRAYHLKPYEEFAEKIKELTGLIDEPISLINVQVQDFEEQRRNEKLKECEELFQTMLEGYEDLKERVKWEDVVQPSFGNVTKTEKQIEDEIKEFLEQAQANVEVIMAMKTKYEFELLDIFFQTYNIGEVLTEKSRLEDIERRKREEEETQAQAKQEAEAKAEREAPAVVSEPFVTPTPNDTVEVKERQESNTAKAETFTIRFEVKGNRDQLMSLSQFMRNNNIQFTQIK